MPAKAAPGEHGRDLPDNADRLVVRAVEVLELAEKRKVSIATAESCTGGLLSSLLTDQRGLGKWFDRGFVVYTEQAKQEMLGVDPVTIEREGVVSEAVAKELARNALERSEAGVAVGITGFAGPGGPGDETGRVHLAVSSRSGRIIHRECHFGDCGRDKTRALAAGAALEMLETVLSEDEPAHAG
jgi:nicotinamide-nucleotide amidase